MNFFQNNLSSSCVILPINGQIAGRTDNGGEFKTSLVEVITIIFNIFYKNVQDEEFYGFTK